MQPSLAVIIINYRTAEMTIDCVRSLAGELETVPDMQVIVVENGSGDDSAQRIGEAIERERWGDWVILSTYEDNAGFASGNNRGIESVPNAEYVLLLNSDTITHEGCLKYCMGVMEESADIGAMSCRLLNADGSTQNVTRKFPTPLRQCVSSLGLPWHFPRLFGWADVDDMVWDRDGTKRDVDWIGGAFMLIRGTLLRRIGPLDSDFFFYGEDIEFCHRVWRNGMRVHYDPHVTTTHFGGGSSDSERLAAQARNIHAWRGRYLVQRKCYGVWAAWLLRVVDIGMWSARWLWLMVTGRGGSSRCDVARDILKTIVGRLSDYR